MFSDFSNLLNYIFTDLIVKGEYLLINLRQDPVALYFVIESLGFYQSKIYYIDIMENQSFYHTNEFLKRLLKAINVTIDIDVSY